MKANLTLAAVCLATVCTWTANARAAKVEFFATDPGDATVPSEVARWADNGTLINAFVSPYASLAASIGSAFDNLAFDGTYFYGTSSASVARWDASGNLLEGYGGYATLSGIGAPLENLATDGTYFYSALQNGFGVGIARWEMDGTLLNGWGGFAALEGFDDTSPTPLNLATDGAYFYIADGATVSRWTLNGTSLGAYATLSGVGASLNAFAVTVVPAPSALPAGLAMLGLVATRRRRR